MKGEKIDRIPIYFFGTWHETKRRWKSEGLNTVGDVCCDDGPQVPGMDPDWENGMWNCHGLVKLGPIGDMEPKALEETENYIVHRTSTGDIVKDSKLGSSISQVLEYALKPSRESWKKFKKFIDPRDPGRRPADWERKAAVLSQSGRMLAFYAGSLYGELRNWMGIENISVLMYDDPELFEEMICYITDYFLELTEPIVEKIGFDFAYFFEDCCGANGPLFSPAIYKDVFDKYYRRAVKFYKDHGVAFTMIDSDGVVDKFVPLWLESGIDIIFPVEVGKWGESPSRMREKFGKGLKMMGGVDKHVICKGEEAIRQHLLKLKPVVMEGGYLPIPDHRIPPECSYENMLTYVKVFSEVFLDN